MGLTKEKKEEVRQFIIKTVTEHPRDIAKVAAVQFGITRQAISRHIQNLIKEGLLEAGGVTRGISYKLKTVERVFEIDVMPDLSEDRVWREKVVPLLPRLEKNILDICFYGFTEMLNNAIVHSGSNKARIYFYYNPSELGFIIMDFGVGIFKKIQRDFGLEDPKQAILELAKGKLTSDPEKHTGEGIFFTSRAFDKFAILSDNLTFFGHENDDWLLESKEKIVTKSSTAVFMDIGIKSKTILKEVFGKYTSDDGNYGFSKTIVPVKLLQYEGEALMSRSQAKRLIVRFDRFKEVVLDFEGVGTIGQPFADEVFRVFKNQHPDVHLEWIRANKEVEDVINYVLFNKDLT